MLPRDVTRVGEMTARVLRCWPSESLKEGVGKRGLTPPSPALEVSKKNRISQVFGVPMCVSAWDMPHKCRSQVTGHHQGPALAFLLA